MTARVVVVGASVGGVRTVAELRSAGFTGEIVLVDPDAARPYDRPPLSQQLLAGAWDPERAGLGDPARRWGATVLPSRAVGLDPAARVVDLESGERVGYDRLVIATGAVARRLPGPPREGVHVLRTLQDCLDLRADLERGGPLVVIGGGFVGAEVASTARGLGVPVTLVEVLPAPMAAALGEQAGGMLTPWHRAHGVDVRCGVAAERVEGHPRVREVVLADGRRLPADTVVVGIGVTPGTGWLAGSELRIRDGVLVNEFLAATADRTVFALGDVARWYDRHLGRHVRVEHWTNAVEGAGIVAHNIVHPGTPRVHDAIPYFWSDQHGTRVELVGRVNPQWEIAVVEGDAGRRAVLYHDGIWVHAALTMNWPRALALVRRGLATELEVAAVQAELQQAASPRHVVPVRQ
ncbi:FAD-dependent oxidoreductase [Pseudonocardia sp.]|uniref:NAD(P)/FAD-dependent oxidoreductase n=1 Tax=Pseudonocardia sp. TaxID=60912 RepID=UPI0026027486|nr:FAD-dependent oxidoreductase [Pseudonocardia sp.]